MSPEHFAVLITAKESSLRQSIQQTLLATGFALAEASSVEAALDMMRRRRIDLVLVDMNVPDSGAAEACRTLRAQSPEIGIIVFRADGGNGNNHNGDHESADDDEWRMLEAGADDFVVAPFRYREIVARMGAILRRPHAARTKSRTPLLKTGDLELDLTRRMAIRDGKDIHLSPREFDLLAVLMANTGVALTHAKLARNAWGNGTHHNREYLRTYVQSLRQKLENDPSHPQYILTQPWVGYRFCDPLQNKTN
jgi:two-component system KDP operon response regulator KdpE